MTKDPAFCEALRFAITYAKNRGASLQNIIDDMESTTADLRAEFVRFSRIKKGEVITEVDDAYRQGLQEGLAEAVRTAMIIDRTQMNSKVIVNALDNMARSQAFVWWLFRQKRPSHD